MCAYCNPREIGSKFLVADGSYTALYLEIIDEDRIGMYGAGDDYTDYYFPKFCPECGRRLREE